MKSGRKLFQDIVSLETPGCLLPVAMCAWSLWLMLLIDLWGKRTVDGESEEQDFIQLTLEQCRGWVLTAKSKTRV